MPSMDREPLPSPSPPAMENVTHRTARDRLAAVLDDAGVRDPARLSSTLRGEPVRTELQTILAQLDPARLLPILHRLATTSLPNQREVLEALLAADPSSSGQALGATLRALHRQALLARIFHPHRVQALRHACRPLAQGPA